MDSSDINRLAKLARLQIDEQTAAETAESITRILALVDQLQNVECENIPPMAHPLDATQRLRDDVVTESDEHEAFQSIAPAVEQNLYLVPKVIDPS